VPLVRGPAAAGVGSAVGLLQAEPRIDVSMTRLLRLEAASAPAIAGLYAELEARARAELAHLGGAEAVRWRRYGYLRYAGQGFELHVDLPDGTIDAGYPARAAAAFHAAYERKHRYRDDAGAVEAVDWALIANLPRPAGGQWRYAAGASGREGHRRAWFPEAGGYTETAVLGRASIGSQGIAGPAIVEDADCTTVVLPGDRARLDGNGHLLIEIARDKP
jgi:N-methylhydantoinase A